MPINRRNLLKQLGMGIAAGSAWTSASTSGAAERTTLPVGGMLRLDRNESPYGPSKKAVEAWQACAKDAAFYVDDSALQKALAGHHGVSPEQIVVGCGSSDVLRMVAHTLLTPNKLLILAKPTCALLPAFGKGSGAKIEEVALRKDQAHDLEAMLGRTAKESGAGAGGVVYICNPNTPTGTLTARKELEEFIEKVPDNFYVVIDEAYHEYAGGSGSYVSFVERPSKNPRVIVTRTFSAAYGLAGARVGYAVASSAAATKLEPAKLPYSVNRAGASAALAALQDREHLELCIKRNFDDRQEFLNQVNARMLRALDSHANFVCLNVMRPAGEILEHYRNNKIALAPAIPGMLTYLRVSLGSPEQMKEFWRVWDKLGSHPMAM